VTTEAKLAPSRSEVLEWLVRIRNTNSGGAFKLVFGGQSTAWISNVDTLIRIATESARRDRTVRPVGAVARHPEFSANPGEPGLRSCPDAAPHAHRNFPE